MTEPTAKCCGKCGKVKPLTEFHSDRTKPDGLRGNCKLCVNAAHRHRLGSDPELRRNKKRHERERDPEKWQAAKNASAGRRQARQRERVFDHYGWACACCSSTEDLTVDHLDGSGHSHRLKLFGHAKKTGRIYAWLIKEGFPDGFATLCRRCNSSKRVDDRCHLHPHAGIWLVLHVPVTASGPEDKSED